MAEPIRLTARLVSLDVLRGFALLGILVLNIEDFASPTAILHDIPLDVVSMAGPHHMLDVALMTLQWLFFEGKMRALFATLFGAGTILILDRLEQSRGEGVAADIFHRRNMWLMVFGAIHGLLIWAGDVLLSYGSVALLFLYPLRKASARRLILAGLSISLIGGTVGLAGYADLRTALPAALFQESARAARIEHRALSREEVRAVAEAAAKRRAELAALPRETAEGRVSYWAGLADNSKMMFHVVGGMYSTGLICEVIGLMIMGMGLYKAGFLSARLSSRIYLVTAATGYAIAIPLVLAGLYHAQQFGFSDAVTTVWLLMPYMVQEVACMLANASVVLLLIKHGRLVPVQRGLAAVGRTAFSNYIMTSLLCRYLFNWGPFKLYGVLEYYQYVYVIAGVWAINITASVLWLRTFAFGPLEWVWRSLTYWQRQPLRLASPRPPSPCHDEASRSGFPAAASLQITFRAHSKR